MFPDTVRVSLQKTPQNPQKPMLAMTVQDVRLGAAVSSKEEAIRAVGEVLLSSGSIEPEYVESMLAREKTATTFLGNGLAIPHGRPQDSARILQTRVAVLQIPGGVAWGEGKTAHLVFGIAAKSDEHIGLLRQLTGIVGDADLARRLSQTTDAREILAAVSTGPEAIKAPRPRRIFRVAKWKSVSPIRGVSTSVPPGNSPAPSRPTREKSRWS